MKNAKLTKSLLVIAAVCIVFFGVSKLDIEPTDKNIKTIQTYLENELNGPNEELSEILTNLKSPYPPELDAYVIENYEPLFQDYRRFITGNLVLIWQRNAHDSGYLLETINIEINKIENIQNDAYKFKVDVEYSKSGITNKATVTGITNVNDNGKISTIRNLNDNGLMEKLRQ